MKDMLLIVGETDLLNLIQDMPGWQNLQVRYLSGEGHARYFNVHLTKKQVAFLGAAKIKATYHAEEYKQGKPGGTVVEERHRSESVQR